MTRLHKTEPYCVHAWDWKEQPDFEIINDMLTQLRLKFKIELKILEIETGADEFAIVIGPHSLTKDLAKFIYDECWNEENEDYE